MPAFTKPPAPVAAAPGPKAPPTKVAQVANANADVLAAIAKIPASPSVDQFEAALADLKKTIIDGFKVVADSFAKISVVTKETAPAAPKPAGAKAPPPKPAAAVASTATTPSAKPASAAATTASSTGAAAANGDLDSLSRKQLADLAQSLGIAPAGIKAPDLVIKIREVQAASGGAAPASSETVELTESQAAEQSVLMNLVAEHWDTLSPWLEGTKDLANNVLGCMGDCGACPNPEGHPTAGDQIHACFVSMHESLGLDAPVV